MDHRSFSSNFKIHCKNCSVQNHQNGTKTFSHKAITSVLVSPGNEKVISTLYQWVEKLEAIKAVETVVVKRWTGNNFQIDTYRFVNLVPLRDSQDALQVNWCQITTTDATGKTVYKNAIATNFTISKND